MPGMEVFGVASLIENLGDIRGRWGGSHEYLVGTNVPYGLSLEVGDSSHPAYPWLRPAFRDVVRNQGDELADEADSAGELARDIAFAMERQAKINVSARGEGMQGQRSSGTHPDHPGVVTENLIGSIKAVRVR